MQEIEIKFKVDDIDSIKNKLLKLGCVFSSDLIQKDTIFIPDLNDIATGEGKIFIRIRKVNDKNELTLKRQSNSTSQSKEIEFEISNFDSAYDFLETLGLKEWVTVEKKRVTTKYKDFNICIDSVKRLGDFIEIEIITPEDNKVSYYEEEILKIAKEFQIDINNRINNHYDTMINELNVRGE